MVELRWIERPTKVMWPSHVIGEPAREIIKFDRVLQYRNAFDPSGTKWEPWRDVPFAAKDGS